MSTQDTVGDRLHGDDPEARIEAARTMGKARTEKKIEATRANISRINERKRLHGVSEETKAKLREAQRLRREREKQARLEVEQERAKPENVQAIREAMREISRRNAGQSVIYDPPQFTPKELKGTDSTKEKRPVGRPRKQVDPQAEALPKRGRGRPRKTEAEAPRNES